MEVNITRAFQGIAPMDYSASIAEIGQNAGRATWDAAKEDANDYGLLATAAELQAMREFIRDAGAWNAEEIAAFTDTELRALFLQWIAGDMRESGLDSSPVDWDEYTRGCEAGLYPSRIFRADDGRIFFELGS